MSLKLLVWVGLVCSCVRVAGAQGACHGSPLSGVVRDSTLALIPGATVSTEGGLTAVSGNDGRFALPCVPAGTMRVAASADGFAKQTLIVKVPHAAAVEFTLQAGLETDVEVSGDSAAETSTTVSGPTQTISGARLQSLADDPDDLERELQQLAAASGGNPANTTISVDGFQGNGALPPKASISYIEVNPDQFSAEYREPPFEGGRVNVYTKPGQKTFHGALFATNGSPWENARDPFSTSKGAIGKQRYGFELTGPITKKNSDFALNLEHRDIQELGVVDAITLGANGAPVTTVQNTPQPQHLWIGLARVDWQLGQKNTFTTSFNARVNDRPNYGVGGTNLTETGYDSQRYDNSLHLSDVTVVSAHLMHEARLSLRWDGQTNTPNSTAPQVQVSGAFTGGGSTVGMQRERELNTEIDDDAILTTKNHTVKFGTFLMLYRERQQEPANFNGTYMFQDLAHYAAGVPETYTAVTGTPAVNFTEVEDALFVQDDWNVGHGVHVAGGLRYFWQTQPATLGSIDPRLGVVWAPGKKPTWTLHAHAGLFASQMSPETATQVREQDGAQRVTSTVYNPVYGAPFSGAPTVIHTERAFSPHVTNLTWGGENVGGTKSLPKGWNLSVDYYFGRIWNDMRSENINSPLNGSPTGPRPGQPNLNVLQVQNSGQGKIGATFAGVEQHSLKHVQFFFGGVRVRLIDDTDDNEFFTPQSAFTDAGEFAPRSSQSEWQVFGNATITLPAKAQLSLNGNASGDAHYNITTGFDNNGDGDFNDRPQYALPGQAGAVQTPYGLLVATGGTGVLRRNLGQMPWVYYIDANVQRTFALTHDAKDEHPQTLTVNVRSSNVINHTNVTSVGGVLGSPLFGVGYAADPSRRVELGARYSF